MYWLYVQRRIAKGEKTILTNVSKRQQLIKIGLARCKKCDSILKRLDDPFNGFCSERCDRIFNGIRKLKPKDLHHIVYWYYVQRRWKYQNEVKNKKAYRSLKKLLEQLDEVFPD